MERPLLAYTLWLGLTADQKIKLTKLYSIPRTGEVVVHVGEMMGGNIGGEAKQDGHRPEDLYAVTAERNYELLNDKLPEKPDFYGSFQAVLDNLDSIYAEQYPETSSFETEEVKPTSDSAPLYQKSEEEFVPRDPEELIKPKAEASAEEPKIEKNAKTTKAKGPKAK